MYQITEQGLRELELYIQEIPFKYANNILKLLGNSLIKPEQPKLEETTKEEKPKK